MDQFNEDIYRKYNVDLQGLSDSELLTHFKSNPHERRIYGATKSTTQLLSMRWLRGNGIEIGAGRHKTPMYGNAISMSADCSDESVYGTEVVELEFSIENRDSIGDYGGKFDFAVASHVLEHTDSFLRSLENLLAIIKIGGIVYVVLPDIRFLHDINFIPNFDFKHHILEYENPLLFALMHDKLYINSSGDSINHLNMHADLDDKYKSSVIAGNIAAEFRYIHHKHNYDFNDWVHLFFKAQKFFANRFKIQDIRFGHERLDCHFIIERKF